MVIYKYILDNRIVSVYKPGALFEKDPYIVNRR
jgi:hypothetical protein